MSWITTASPVARGPAARAATLDAARFVLISLVVAAHLLEHVRHLPHLQVLYRFIYLFHMPAFVFLSGMVASDVLDSRRARRLLFGVVGVYLLHQAFARALEAHLSGNPFSYQLDVPYWALWYLVSLVLWRMSLPVLLVLRYPIAWAVGLALVAGVLPFAGYTWSLSRTLAFYPFFVSGYLWTQRQGMRLPSVSPQLSIALLCALAGVAWLTRDFSLQWYYNATGYARMGLEAWQGVGWRSVYLAVAGLGVLAVLSLCSRVDARWSALGRCSMAAYVLHIYLVKYAIHAGWLKAIVALPASMRFVAVLFAGTAIAAGFSLVGRAMPWLFDLDWLHRWLGLQQGGAGTQGNSVGAVATETE